MTPFRFSQFEYNFSTWLDNHEEALKKEYLETMDIYEWNGKVESAFVEWAFERFKG
jgi:hypothetical protein